MPSFCDRVGTLTRCCCFAVALGALFCISARAELISVDSNGAGMSSPSTGGTYPSFSGDGRYVAFDSNYLVGSPGANTFNVFVRDRQNRTTTLVSVSSANARIGGNSSSGGPTITPDGRYVFFFSYATDLVPGITYPPGGSTYNFFRRDLVTGTTVLVSVDPTGTAAGNGNSSAGPNQITPDGRFVAFQSDATNLDSRFSGYSGIYVRDLTRNTTELITVDPSGTTSSNGGSYAPVISADGRYVAYYSYSTNLVNGITYNPNTDNLFLRDRMNGTTSLISIGTDGISAANGPTNQPTMSADGSKIAFTSQASNLVAGITYAQNPFPGVSFPTNPNVFLWDRMTNTTIVVSKAPIGNDTGGGASPAISPDGSTIAFLSTGTNLTVGNNYLTNPFTNSPVLNLFVYDVPGKTVSLVSGAEGSNDAANADVYPGNPAISADGAQIAFASFATNIVKANYPSTGAVTPQNVFFADFAANTMTLVTGGNFTYFYAPVISQNGRYVASSNGNVLFAYPNWSLSGSPPPGTPPGTPPMGGGGGSGGGGGCASVTVTQKGDYGLLMLLLAAFGYRYWSGRKLRPRHIPTA
jgi:Tol biopolymer transport system component